MREKENPDSEYGPLGEAIADTYDEMAAAEKETEEAEVKLEVDDGEEVAVLEEEIAEVAERIEEEVETPAKAQDEGEEVDLASEEAIYDEPAPERWPEEIRDVYDNLEPSAKKAMLDGVFKPMQSQYTKATGELAQVRKTLQPMLDTIGQHKEDFMKMGINPVEAFNRQMSWAVHIARVGPEQGLADMAKSYGIDKAVGGQAEETTYLTPTERSLQDGQNVINQTLKELTDGRDADRKTQNDEATGRRQTEIRTGLEHFHNETKDGKPAHPYLEKVAPQMTELIKRGMVMQNDQNGYAVPIRDVLGKAYEMACRLDTTISRTTTPPRRRQANRASAASRADVVTNLSAGKTDRTMEEKPLSDSISEIYDRLERQGG